MVTAQDAMKMDNMTDDPQAHQIAHIRKLLKAAFTPESLRRFCHEHPLFRPVYDEFSPAHGLNDLVDRVIMYCEKNRLCDELLAEVGKRGGADPTEGSVFPPSSEKQLSSPGWVWGLLVLIALDLGLISFWGWCLLREQSQLMAYVEIVVTVAFGILGLVLVGHHSTRKSLLQHLRTERTWHIVIPIITGLFLVVTALFWPLGWLGTCVERPTRSPSPTLSPTLTAPPTSTASGQIMAVLGLTGRRDVFVMDIDGGSQIKLTNSDSDNWDPAWAPGQAYLAFVSDRDGNPEIYKMHVESHAVTRLTNHQADDLDPTWAPDGIRIAFTSERDGNPEIYVLEVQRGGITRLTDDPASDAHPSWSPDGQRLAFASNRDGNWEIYVMSATGGQLVNMTNSEANDREPSWSPDGTWITFTSDQNENLEIYTLNVETQGLTRLTFNQCDDWSPSWTQDGRYIIFRRGLNKESGDIYRIDTDGTGERRVTY
ncbi:MAG: PD40 domain-containing protein [Anaerolineae bacterium]|nr:PD40 domain-containing protein [Anaerolineae bacterium]